MPRTVLDLPARRFQARDGAELVYRELGEGRPLILIHGFFSTATVNWVKYGHAERLANAGHRVIMPDLRGHGDSAKPHDAGSYPADVLTDDAFDLIERLRLEDYDLAGYSLGGRTVIRLLARGAAPGRAVVAGMGLDGILDPGARNDFFRGVLSDADYPVGSPQWRSRAFLKTTRGDAAALAQVLETSVPTDRETLARIATPTLVILGETDGDHGDGEALANALPAGSFRQVPGNHMSAVTEARLSEAIAAFLDGDRATLESC